LHQENKPFKMIIKDTIMRDVGRLFIWFPFRWLIASSPYALARSIAKAMGSIDYIFCESRRNMLIQNLGNVFRDRIDTKKAAKGIMGTHYLNLLEFFKFSTINKSNIFEHVNFSGKRHLDSALDQGRGAILATLHFGTMQYPLVALGHLGYPINQLGDRDTKAPEFSYIHRKIALKYRIIIEKSFKAKHIHISRSIIPMYRCLKNNELLMINVDGVGGLKGQRLKANYLQINFLGHRAFFPAGAARLSRKMGSPIIPVVCIRQPDGRHKIAIDSPIDIHFTENQDYDIQICTQKLLNHMEKYIKMYPDQWLLWMEFKQGYMIV